MHKPILQVFKIGGKVVEHTDNLHAFLEAFARLSNAKILVHGGGKWVTEMSERLGIAVKMVDGRRITNAATLEVVKMMLAGVANKNVVSQLQQFGCNAMGMTGADGNAIRAEKRPPLNGIDYGFVGDVQKVNDELITQLLKLNIVPVFAAMTHDARGNMLNTNADTIAASVAVGLAQHFRVQLNYCFELNGVLEDINDPESVISHITTENYLQLKEAKIIHTGMIPKIDNAFNALDAGVDLVRIMNATHIGMLANGIEHVGTLITH